MGLAERTHYVPRYGVVGVVLTVVVGFMLARPFTRRIRQLIVHHQRAS